MKKFLLSMFVTLGLLAGAHAAGGDTIAWDKAPARGNDMAALQNGAKLFVNYCLNCHSAAYMRFNRLRDIGLTEQQIKDNLLIGTDRVGDTMKAAIDPKQAKDWFGANPPDLTLVARSRASHSGPGADYLYTYLRSYYRDDTKANGWNNLAFPSVGMPNVLWELQGNREPVFEMVKDGSDKTVKAFKGWKQTTPGTMTPAQFDHAIGDLVGYLHWMAEPAQGTRVRVGVWVFLFLLAFTVIAWRLNAAFWKDVR